MHGEGDADLEIICSDLPSVSSPSLPQPVHHNKKTSRKGAARRCLSPPGPFDLLALMRKAATLIIEGKKRSHSALTNH